jgi:hypothetical protein
LGPKVIWEAAADTMWRPDAESEIRSRMADSMTYVLSFFDHSAYAESLIAELDLDDPEKFTRTSQLLESLKQFRLSSRNSYSKNNEVAKFYERVLENIAITPQSNYLLSLRVREISKLLEGGMFTVVSDERLTTSTTQHRHLDWVLEQLAEDDITTSDVSSVEEVAPPGQLSEIDMLDFTYLQTQPIRELLEREFNFNYTDLGSNERLYFLSYLKHTTVAEAERMQGFTKQYGVAGMRTFLALSQRTDVSGDDIVAFGEQAPALAGQVFCTYSEVLDQSNSIEDLIRQQVGDSETEVDQLVTATNDIIFTRANDFLAAQLREPVKVGETPLDVSGVGRAQGKAAVSAALRLGVIKGVEDLRGFQPRELTGSEVLADTTLFASLTDIYREIYVTQYGYSDAGVEDLIKKFTEQLSTQGAVLHLWQIGDGEDEQVLAFLLVTDEGSQRHMSALNVNPSFADSRAGLDLLDEAIERSEAEGSVVTAEAAPDNARAYISLYGFVGTARHDDPDEPYVLDLARAPGAVSAQKKVSRKEVFEALADSSHDAIERDGIAFVRARDKGQTLDNFFARGYVVTHMYPKREGGKVVNYFVLEQLPSFMTQLDATSS